MAARVHEDAIAAGKLSWLFRHAYCSTLPYFHQSDTRWVNIEVDPTMIRKDARPPTNDDHFSGAGCRDIQEPILFG